MVRRAHSSCAPNTILYVGNFRKKQTFKLDFTFCRVLVKEMKDDLVKNLAFLSLGKISWLAAASHEIPSSLNLGIFPANTDNGTVFNIPLHSCKKSKTILFKTS